MKQYQNHKSLFFYVKKDLLLYLMLLLPVGFFVLFYYVPMYGITIAFKEYNLFKGIFESPWVGLDIFKEVFAMKDFFKVVRNTLMLNALDLICGFPAPIFLALVLNEIRKERIKKLTQTIIYLPHFLSWVIIGGIVTQLLSPESGLINIWLKSVGLETIPFLTRKIHWVFTYTAVGVWQNAGWGTVIYLAALSGIDTQLYEASEIDGAGRLRQIWHITLPGIKPTIIILLILTVGKLMGISFERPYVLGNSLVREYADVISTFVYRVGLESARFSVATAVGLFQSLIGMALLAITNYAAEKSGEQGVW